MAADGVDLVDEDDGRRIGLGLFEEVADAGGTHTHEHLDEVRPRDREERHPRLARDRAGEQGLAGSGRAVEQDSLGDLGTHRGEAGGLLEELLDLLEFLDSFLGPGDVGERRLGHVLADDLGLRLAEGHEFAAAALHLVEEEEQQEQDQQDRQERHQQRDQQVLLRDLDVIAVLELALVELGLQHLLQLHALAGDVLRGLLGPVVHGQVEPLVLVDQRGLGDLVVLDRLDRLSRRHLGRTAEVRHHTRRHQQKDQGKENPQHRTAGDSLHVHGGGGAFFRYAETTRRGTGQHLQVTPG